MEGWKVGGRLVEGWWKVGGRLEGWKVGPNGSQNDPPKGSQMPPKTLPKTSQKRVPKEATFWSQNAPKPLEFIGFLLPAASTRGSKIGTKTPPKTIPRTSQKGAPRRTPKRAQNGAPNLPTFQPSTLFFLFFPKAPLPAPAAEARRTIPHSANIS